MVGSCYGFDVVSPHGFRLLREASGGIPLQVSQVSPWAWDGDPDAPCDLEWPRSQGRDVHLKLYVRSDHLTLWSDREGWLRIDPAAPSISFQPQSYSVRLEHRIWAALALCAAQRGSISVHAAAVEVDGRAVLIGAPGRFGKTTLGGAFLRAGYRLLTEDMICCTASPTPVVHPGPALLRIRDDVYPHVEFPGTEVVFEEPGRVYLAVNPALRGDGRPVPLRAMVFLGSPGDRIALESLDMSRCLPNLWALSGRLPGDADTIRCFQGAASLAAQVPAWELRRPLRFDNLDRVVEAIVATCLT